jgi:hypothetical protein
MYKNGATHQLYSWSHDERDGHKLMPNQHSGKSIYKFSKIRGDTTMGETRSFVSEDPEGLSKAASY